MWIIKQFQSVLSSCNILNEYKFDKILFSAVINVRMCKQILYDLEHEFVYKAKATRRIIINFSGFGLVQQHMGWLTC